MEKNENKEGNWLNIPYEILSNPELDSTEKILLAEIQSLHKLEKGCFASNEHFALLIGMKTASAASRRITRLTEMGYITTKNHYGSGNCVGRVITPTFKKAPDQSAVKVPEHSGGSSDRNQVVPERQGGSSDPTRGVVPDELGGSSDSTRGVVPLRQGGSSERNTINTITNTEILKQEKRTNILLQATSTDTGVEDHIFLDESLPTNPDDEQLNTTSTDVINSSSSGSRPEVAKISIQEYRAILNDFFEGYRSWEADLYKLGVEEFIQHSADYHDNNEDYIGMIREFFEI